MKHDRALQSGGSGRRRALAEAAVNALVLLFASTTLAWSYVVPTGSMEKTVLVGDHIIVDKLAYAEPGPLSRYLLPYQSPKYGDIIVFKYPADTRQIFVKRLVGMPGDRIRIVNGQLVRNGAALNEPYVWHSRPFVDAFQSDFPLRYAGSDTAPDAKLDALRRDMLEHHVVGSEVVVPENAFFALGDNRDNSLDSRYWGFVPRSNVIGKPVLIYWSYDAPENELMPETSSDVAQHLADVAAHFVTRTRWSRTFQLVRSAGPQ